MNYKLFNKQSFHVYFTQTWWRNMQREPWMGNTCAKCASPMSPTKSIICEPTLKANTTCPLAMPAISVPLLFIRPSKK